MSDIQERHDDVWLLLPWYLNGTLQPAESGLVAEHLQSCLMCRREFEFLQMQAETVRNHESQQSAPEHSFEKLMHRISTDGQIRQHGKSRFIRAVCNVVDALKPINQGLPRAYAFALAVPVLVAFLVYWWLPENGNTALYHTLSDGIESIPARPGDLKLVVDKRVTVDKLQSLLRDCRVEITGGPSDADTYTLRTSAPGATDDALKCLRSVSFVYFAEPVGSKYER